MIIKSRADESFVRETYGVWSETEVVRPESFPQREHSLVLANLHQNVDGSLVLFGSIGSDLHVLDSKMEKIVTLCCQVKSNSSPYLVLAMSTGIEATVVTKPLIILAVKCMRIPSWKWPLLTSKVLA